MAATKSRKPKAVEAVVVVSKFTDNRTPFTVIREKGSLKEFVPVHSGDYLARGYDTPLMDATARFISHLEGLVDPNRVVIGLMADESGSMGGNEASVIAGINKFVQGMAGVKKVDPEAAGTVLAVIATDGHENASREVSAETLRSIVAKKESEGWTFIFLGANIDAWSQGASLGFSGASSGQTVSYVGTPTGVSSAMSAVTTDATDYLIANSAYKAKRATSGTRSVTEAGIETLGNINAGPGQPMNVTNVTLNAYANVDDALRRAKKKTE